MNLPPPFLCVCKRCERSKKSAIGWEEKGKIVHMPCPAEVTTFGALDAGQLEAKLFLVCCRNFDLAWLFELYQPVPHMETTDGQEQVRPILRVQQHAYTQSRS